MKAESFMNLKVAYFTTRLKYVFMRKRKLLLTNYSLIEEQSEGKLV